MEFRWYSSLHQAPLDLFSSPACCTDQQLVRVHQVFCFGFIFKKKQQRGQCVIGASLRGIDVTEPDL